MSNKKKSWLKTAMKSWKNLSANSTQNSRFEKDVESKSLAEADKIYEKMAKGKGTLESTKVPSFRSYKKDPSTMTETEKKADYLREKIRTQVAKARKDDAKKKGIIK